MAPAPRSVHGSRPLGTLLPRIVRPAFRSMNAAAAQLMADWESIVGPALAAVSAPRRLSAGTLTIACAGPVAMELQHYAPALIGRINTHAGGATVRGLRFVQTTVLARPAVVAPAPVPRWAAEAADTAAASLPPGELRDAIAALGRAVLAESARGKSSTN